MPGQSLERGQRVGAALYQLPRGQVAKIVGRKVGQQR